MGSIRWWIRVAIWLGAALALTACDASVDVNARVNEDGSGVVNVVATLDSEAAADLLDLRTSGIALTDLNQAGWETSVDTRGENGATVLSASKAFGTPAQFSQVMAELSGEAGLFNDFKLVRTPGFAQVDYEVQGTLAPQGFASFSDPALEAALGTTVQAIAVKYGTTASDIEVTMSITLPGDVKTDASTGVPLPDSAESGRLWATTAAKAMA